MSKTKKIISILLTSVVFVCALLLLCSCLPYVEVHVDGVYALLDKSDKTALVHSFDKDSNVGAYEAQVCYVPETIYYDDEIYTVTELSGNGYEEEFVIGGHVKKLVIPQTVTSIDLFSFCLTDTFDFLEEIQVHTDNEYYASFGGALYTKDFRTLVMYPPAKSDATMFIPREVVQICENQLNYCNQYVEKVSVESGNTVFSEVDGVLMSFGGTRLEYVPYGHNGVLELPDGVQIIGKLSLRYANIQHMYLPESVYNVECPDDIEYNPLRYVSNLYFEGSVPRYIVGWSKYLMEVHNGVTREDFREMAKV